jgi:hypothetical protein
MNSRALYSASVMWLTAESVHRARDELGELTVPVLRGGAMVLRPLVLHASHKVFVDRPRRVLHYVYGPWKLPFGLRWPPSRDRAQRAFAHDCSGSPIFIGPFDSPEVL